MHESIPTQSKPHLRLAQICWSKVQAQALLRKAALKTPVSLASMHSQTCTGRATTQPKAPAGGAAEAGAICGASCRRRAAVGGWGVAKASAGCCWEPGRRDEGPARPGAAVGGDPWGGTGDAALPIAMGVVPGAAGAWPRTGVTMPAALRLACEYRFMQDHSSLSCAPMNVRTGTPVKRMHANTGGCRLCLAISCSKLSGHICIVAHAACESVQAFHILTSDKRA